jgi:hypothetical protein
MPPKPIDFYRRPFYKAALERHEIQVRSVATTGPPPLCGCIESVDIEDAAQGEAGRGAQRGVLLLLCVHGSRTRMHTHTCALHPRAPQEDIALIENLAGIKRRTQAPARYGQAQYGAHAAQEYAAAQQGLR